MYGHRARIGYAGPLMCQEVIPYEFYQMVPKGVTMMMVSLDLVDMTEEEVNDSAERGIRAGKVLARMGADIVVWGGGPILIAEGLTSLEDRIAALEKEFGIPVTTTMTASANAMIKLGSKKVVSVPPHPPIPWQKTKPTTETSADALLERMAGVQVVGEKSIPAETLIELGGLDSEMSAQTGREIFAENPEADTIYFGGPHRPIADQIDNLERECGANVVTSLQAAIWEALRRAGVSDSIDGFGRLFREF
jgi:maleate isomerase